MSLAFRSMRFGALTLVVASVCSATDAGAQQPVPVVTIQEVTEPQVFFNQCVEPTDVQRTPGEVVFARSEAGSELTVEITVTGPVEDPPEQAVFAAGAETTVIELTPREEGLLQEPVEVTVVDGDDYDVGEPSSESFFVAVATPQCVTTTTASTTPPTTSTTPEVGPTTASKLPATGPASPNVWLSLVGLAAVSVGALLLVRARQLRSEQ